MAKVNDGVKITLPDGNVELGLVQATYDSSDNLEKLVAQKRGEEKYFDLMMEIGAPDPPKLLRSFDRIL